ncbi:MAG: DUF2946 family protein [Pseudomonadota bacterium]
MQALQSLRRASFLARLVLAWFALSIGVAVASPLVKPHRMELVCSASGIVKLVTSSDEDSPSASSHTFECPLCLVAGAPPHAACAQSFAQENISQPLPANNFARFSKAAAAPLPARGPPSFVTF